MNDPRESDIFNTKMDLIDLSRPEIDEESLLLSDTVNESENPSNQQGTSLASSTMSRAGGFCVKEYEEQLDNLQKENFNLKLRVYFFEQRNPNIPEDVETLMQQIIDLKVQNESLYKDLHEKQDLLCQASKALELLEDAKQEDGSHVEKIVESLKDKIASLESENLNLQQALSDANNKTNLANDTGFTEFLGAVEAKDADVHRKLAEMTQTYEELQCKINDMTIMMQQLEVDNKALTEKASKLQYEKDEIKDRMESIQSSSNEMHRKLNFSKEVIQEKVNEAEFLQASNIHLRNCREKLNKRCENLQFSNYDLTVRVQEFQEMFATSNLETELREYKNRWASTQCDLDDMEKNYKETEEERQNALKLLQSTLETLAETNQKVEMYEELLQKTSSLDKNEAKKDIEIVALKRELENVQKKLQHVSSSELQEKNKEINRLQELINSLRVDRHSIASEPPRFSFDYLYENFNDLKFQQAMEIKKQSQQKIDQLIMEIEKMANSASVKQLEQLKVQMAIVAEKQQITDTALNRCTELCAFTLDHLQELTQFLTALLQNKQIRESLTEASLHNIQSIIEKSLDLSHRQSMGNFSFNDISSLDILVNAARQSICNIREVKSSILSTSKGVQASLLPENPSTMEVGDYEELKRVNQLLEDEIVEIKSTMRIYEKKSSEYKSEIVELKSVKDELTAKLEKTENAMRKLEEFTHDLQLVCDDYKVEVEHLTKNFASLRDELISKTTSYQECLNMFNDTSEELQKVQTKNYQLESQLDFSEKNVQSLEVAKIKYESMWKESDRIAKELETRLKHIEHDLQDNWITKNRHDSVVKNMQDEIVNAEAQVAAIRMELDKMKIDCNQKRSMYQQSFTVKEVDFKENEGTTTHRRQIDISEDRKKILMCNDTSDCIECPRYQSKIVDLKKHLQYAVDKLKEQSKWKAMQDRTIKKQLDQTEHVMKEARGTMESILKVKNSNEQQ